MDSNVVYGKISFLKPIFLYCIPPTAKAGMRRPDPSDPHGTESNKKMKLKKNDVEPVPEIQGKAKAGHKKAKPC